MINYFTSVQTCKMSCMSCMFDILNKTRKQKVKEIFYFISNANILAIDEQIILNIFYASNKQMAICAVHNRKRQFSVKYFIKKIILD